MTRICKITNCDKTQSRRGICVSHYAKNENNVKQWSRKEVLADRPAILKGDLAYIPLGLDAKDGYAIVDKDMAWLADSYKWGISETGYAVLANSTRKKLHHFILPLKDGFTVDHINRIRLDNRKSNLRLVTHSQNAINSVPRSSNGYKGVSYSKRTEGSRKVWRSYIKVNGKQISLKCHETAEEAAKAYDKAAQEYFGEFAYLNFSKGVTQ